MLLLRPSWVGASQHSCDGGMRPVVGSRPQLFALPSSRSLLPPPPPLPLLLLLAPLALLVAPAVMEGGAAAAAADSCTAAVLPAKVDVLVVGAGISGLVAASKLQGRFRLGVLEARQRVGGRLLSTPGGADLGGSWSWSHDRKVAALAQQLGARPVGQRLDGDAMYKRGGAIQSVGNVGDRIAPCGPGAQRITGGYATLATTLAAQLPPDTLCLGCAASRLEHNASSGTVSVTYSQASGSDGAVEKVVEARAVIIAVPPRIVASLTFDPPLPADQAGKMKATPTWCGDWAKIVATFSSPFWQLEGKSGAAATQDDDDLVSSWWEAEGGGDTAEPSAALAGLAFGDAGERLGRYPTSADGNSGDELRARVVKELSALFGVRVEKELMDVHHKAWITDPLTFGPPLDPEAEAAAGDPRASYGDRRLWAKLPWQVHFAGTETEAQSGHVEGAIIAGERAAREVTQDLE
jgi:monoamine oxidase